MNPIFPYQPQFSLKKSDKDLQNKRDSKMFQKVIGYQGKIFMIMLKCILSL